MSRDETHDAACRWAFRKTFRRRPTPDELRDYKLALDERDRLGLYDALPIFARLRSEADLAPAKARPEHRRKVAVTVIEPSASPAAPPPEPEPPQPEPVPASPPAGNGRPRAKERAEAFVREQLANGPRYGELVKRDAAEYAKISERTLIAAAERLGGAAGKGSGGCRGDGPAGKGVRRRIESREREGRFNCIVAARGRRRPGRRRLAVARVRRPRVAENGP